MNKRVISAVVSLAMLASAAVIPMTAQAAEAKTPKYQKNARQMEKLNRGLIAVKNANGVYLSWRLLGDESLEKQEFDIYKDGTYIATVEGGEATCYTDKNGLVKNKYKVVASNATEQQIKDEPWVTPQETKGDTTWTYFDVPISKPTDIAHANTTALSDYTRTDGTGGANDASLGDLDGDGDYEIVLKWDPKDAKDSSHSTTTGHCVFDAYEIDPNNGGYMWRIDIGNNIAAGAHYSQFMVYDFDGNGKAEIATLTAPGAYSLVKNESGGYDKIWVTSVGDTEKIRNADNNATTLRKGNNNGPEYYTIFDGETGRPLRTTDAIPIGPLNENGEVDSEYEDGRYWGDSKMNRSERYLAAVAYLDGVTPYYVPIRGMYNRTIIRAYTWDGENLTLVKEHNGDKKGSTMYGEGNHNLSVADIDNDGKDEIVYGSACLDDDFTTVLGNTKMGHGDAMHVSDFNNDGTTEVFSVKEDSEGYSRGIDFRVAKTGEAIWSKRVSTDNGRGVMDNIDDAYAATHPDALALGWDAANSGAYDFKGNEVAAKPSGNSRSFCNFLVYWDDDLGRELLDDNQMSKYHADTGVTDRLFFNGLGYLPGNSNNSSKQTPSLVADLWGDWREEIIMPADNDTVLRIMTSTTPTKYRLTTLMHDSQYRLAIAWQNVGYNQPPHTSYYIGSAALATDASGNTLNYLAPAMPYTTVTYDAPEQVDVTGVEITNKNITLEQGTTAYINTVISPEDATKKGITWTTSDEKVAIVSNGTVIGVGAGTATITATTKDGGFTDTCTVEVFATPATGVSVSEKLIELGIGNKIALEAKVYPDNATVKTVTWTSEDTSVATVSADGTVTGEGYGKTDIVATTSNGKTATCIVKVKPMNIADMTGEDVFESSNADGETIKLENASATGGTLNHKAASTGGEMHKDFESYDSGTATFKLRFTTGGQRIDGSNWNWTGHEYTLGLNFLDTAGNSILDISQAWTSGAQATQSAVAGESKKNISGDWTKTSADGENPIGRSTTRWEITLEFDYDNDICNATLSGASVADTGEWVIGQTYKKSFALNGASFKTLQVYSTKDGDGAISLSPILQNVSYKATEQISGNTDVLYKRGTDNTEWTENDLTDWTQNGTDTAILEFDSENGRIWYNAENPGAAYSAEKTFKVTPGAVVSYDVDWYFGSAVNRPGNYEYIQFGDSLRLGWTDGYKVFLSTDGGETYGEDAIFTGGNTTYTKNVKAQFNTALKTVTLSFDGKQIYSGTYSDTDEVTADGANLVKFGFTRAGAPPTWAVPNGIDRIRVAQFVEGEEAPDFNCVRDIAVDQTDAKTVNFKYGLVKDFKQVTVLAAIYNDAKELVELKTEVVHAPTNGQYVPYSMTFDSDIDKQENVKVFIWNTLDEQEPIAYTIK